MKTAPHNIYRYCVGCKTIYGCYFFGEKLYCSICVMTCSLQMSYVSSDQARVMEKSGYSISGGACRKCYLKALQALNPRPLAQVTA